MSNSDSDPSDGVFNFQNYSTTLCARGPHINSMSSMSLKNSSITSRMNLPWNFGRPGYAGSTYEQGNMYSRRETSPRSTRSVSGLHPRDFHHSYYPGGLSSQRSVYNGRSGSPMSIRTIDSNASVSAVEIAQALKTLHFNNDELRIIKKAFNNLEKKSLRKRIEKRRNIRMRLKESKNTSGGESGEQGSDSSLSDDCRSVRSYKSAYRTNRSSCRSTRTDITDFRRTMQESNIYRDCTDTFRQNTFRSMLPVGPESVKENFHPMAQSLAAVQKHRYGNEAALPTQRINQNNPSVAVSISGKSDSALTQNKRFKSGFQLPSQRFSKNQSITSFRIPQIQNQTQRNNGDILLNSQKVNILNQIRPEGTDSEQEEIFSDKTVVERSEYGNKSQGKRSLDDDDNTVSSNKRTKLSTPQNSNTKSTRIQTKILLKNDKTKEFVFAKPQFPIRKINNIRKQTVCHKTPANNKSLQTTVESGTEQTTEKLILKPKQPAEIIIQKECIEKLISKSKSQEPKEQLISKSSQPLDIVEQQNNGYQNKEQDNQSETTDISMRPSFIKRKLFSQKVDMAEKNSSSDNIEENSPENNIYGAIQKEKNKARKLVTSQSCLNRDVLGDESNFLDLIHKIVPPDRMNVTNRSEIYNNKSRTVSKNIKWDNSTIIASCNNTDDVSDAYTDEEIFVQAENATNTDRRNLLPDNKNGENTIKPNSHKNGGYTINKPDSQNKNEGSAINKADAQNENRGNAIDKSDSPDERNSFKKSVCKILLTRVKSFWDTDEDSDFDFRGSPIIRSDPKKNSSKASTNQENIDKYQVPKKHGVKSVTPVSEITTVIRTHNVDVERRSNETKVIKKSRKPKASVTAEKPKPVSTKYTKLNTPQVADNAQKPKLVAAKNTKCNTLQDVDNTEKTKSLATKITKPKTHQDIDNTEKANPVSRKTTKLNNTLQDQRPVSMKNNKQKDLSPHKSDKKPPLHNVTLKVNSIHKNYNRTARIRTPKIKICCSEASILDTSLNNSAETLCRTLRSRTIDLSGIGSDNKKCLTNNRIAAKKKIYSRVTKSKDNSESDLSFTLTTEKVKQTGASSRTITSRRTKQSDVSFSLTSDNTETNIKLTSSRNRKTNKDREVDIDLLNSKLTTVKTTNNRGKRVCSKK